MNKKVLCKKSYYEKIPYKDKAGYEIYLSDKDKLYDCTYDEVGEFYMIYNNISNNAKYGVSYFHTYCLPGGRNRFEEYFYTPEETKNILRSKLIERMLE